MSIPERIASLVHTLERGRPRQQQAAAEVLAGLVTEQPQLRDAAAEAGALPVLMRLMHADRDDDSFVASAHALSMLAYSHRANTAAALAAGAAPLLTARLAAGGSTRRLQATAATICNLVPGSAADELAVWANAIPWLVNALAGAFRVDRNSASVGPIATGGSGGYIHLRFSAGAALSRIANKGQLHAAMLAAGATSAASEALGSADPQLQEVAALLLCDLSKTAASAASAVETGAVPRLLPLLMQADSIDTQDAAAKALVNLSAFAAPAVVAAGGVPALLRLLRPASDGQLPAAAANAVTALMNLTSRQQAGEIMAHNGPMLVARLLAGPGMPIGVQQAAVKFLQNWAIGQPHLLDAATTTVAVRGLVHCCVQHYGTETPLQLSILHTASAIWGSSQQNQQAMASALEALQHSSGSESSGSRVQEEAALWSNTLTLCRTLAENLIASLIRQATPR